jgi:glycosyltransferase involved in cell wall biosynthesis
MGKKIRIAFIVSHPTQFEVPLYKKITESDFLDIKVFFWTTDKTTNLIDPEIGRPPGWDFSLTEGYDYSILPKNTKDCWTFLKCEVFKSGNYDVVIVNSYMSQAGRLALLAGILFGKSTILRSDTTLLYHRAAWKRLLRSIILRSLFPFINAFMATGTLAQKHFLHYGVSPQKIFLFPYAVDNETLAHQCQYYREQREDIRAMLKIKPDITVILGVLKFVAREGVFDLLRAYAQLVTNYPKLSLVLVGDGEQKESLIDYVQSNKIAGVIFAGYQCYSQLPKYYALADIFVHPAICEPWGVSVNEAMACGLPVIISSLVGASYDLVQDGENGFIYHGGDIASLRNALERFLLSPEKHDAMGKKSLAIVKKWGFNMCLAEIEKVMSYILNSTSK